MAENKYKIGTRLLFTEHPGGEIKQGRVEEYSPSGAFIGLSVARGEAWLPVNRLIVVEELEVPADKPAKAVKAPTASKDPAPADTGKGTEPEKAGNSQGSTESHPTEN